MSSEGGDRKRARPVTGTPPRRCPDRERDYDEGYISMESDVVQLIRSRTPLRDDPAGRAMVRARTERIAAAKSSRWPVSWSRGIATIVPVLVLALAVWATASLPGESRVTPVPTSAAMIARLEPAPDPAPAGPAVHVVPRQPWLALSNQDRGRLNAGLPPLGQPASPRDETRPPNPARSVIVLGQAPAPEALALMRQIQRQRYGG